jgi:hypothetical protein
MVGEPFRGPGRDRWCPRDDSAIRAAVLASCRETGRASRALRGRSSNRWVDVCSLMAAKVKCRSDRTAHRLAAPRQVAVSPRIHRLPDPVRLALANPQVYVMRRVEISAWFGCGLRSAHLMVPMFSAINPTPLLKDATHRRCGASTVRLRRFVEPWQTWW